jgi:hypothetical protein
MYSNFDSVRTWLLNTDVRVILLIDELNVIPSRTTNYDEMSFRLDCLLANCTIVSDGIIAKTGAPGGNSHPYAAQTLTNQPHCFGVKRAAYHSDLSQ